MSRATVSLAVGVLLVCLHARAGDPITNRGIDLSGVYHAGDIDTVNVYNGNVIIDVPLAAQFPLNGGFTYGIHLIYTGQPWDFPMEERTDPNWIPETQSKANPIPNRRSNAGMGWRVSMGRLIPSGDPTNINCQDSNFEPCPYWMYESPDGANHTLGNNSQPGTISDDSSYLRLKTPSGYEELEFPDGTIHRFNTGGMPTAIYTPFDRAASAGPSVTIDYLANDPLNNPCGDTTASSCWKIHDTIGRTQWVTFRYSPNVYGDHQLAQKIIVTAPGSTSVTYTLNYNGLTSSYDYANDTSLHLDTCYTRWGDPNQTVAVPILTRIGLPDGSSYHITTTNAPTSGGGWCFQGSLTKLALPTGGSLDYVYVDFLPGYTGKYSPPVVPGVLERRKTPDDGSATQPWRYSAASADCFQTPDFHNECYSRTVTVTDPDLRASRHHFSTFSDNTLVTNNSIAHGWSPNEVGLPFTRGATTTNPDGETLFLSSENLDSSGNVERSTYVKYEYDVDSNTGTTAAPYRREKSSLIRYSGSGAGHDDGRWSSVTRSLFDHYGHYRQTVTDGNFAAESPASTDLDRRTEFVNYNPARGTWGDSTFSAWPDTSPWLLNTFDGQWANSPKINPNDSSEASSHTKKAEFCFDSSNGFLLKRRLLRNDLRAGATLPDDVLRDPADLVTVFANDTSGNLVSEQSYGGDGASISTSGTLCGLSLSSPRYEVRHTYQNGVRAASQYYDGSSLLPFKSVDRTIDLSGAVSSERDVSGVQTTYTPDPADPLRVQAIARSGTATIVYTYINASTTPSFTPAQITVTQSDVTSRVQYDSFGRMWREFRTIPAIGEVTRETLYDSSNRKQSESVWAAGSYANKTTYHYDFLGRLDTVDPPDHQSVTTSYVGDSSRTTTSKVFLATDPSSAQTDVSTTEGMDRYGRLWYVAEPNATVTAYGYGATGALSRVCMKALLSSGLLTTATCGQERLFSYDNRGVMTSETHPENGTITYTYDAGGHVLTKTPSTAGTQFDLNDTYDDAERLKQVDSRNTLTSFHASKEFTYDARGGANLGLGKPATSTRHNYQANGDDYKVTETYSYNDQAGRLTDRTTEVFNPDGSQLQKFSQTQSYTDLGQPNVITYPSCQGSVPCGSANQSNVVNAYTNGLLASVTGFGSLTYHPSGMVNTVSHGNGVTDTYAIDTTGIPRPTSITFGAFASCSTPAITTPPASPTIQPGNTATLSVAAAPASVTYQWHDADGTPLPGQTGSVFTTPVLNADHSYFVRVSNSCGAITAAATVHVVAANPPVITAQPQSTTTVPGHLTVAATGSAPLSYHWYQGNAGDTSNLVGTNAFFDTPNITVTAKYWVRVSNVAGSADSNVATVTVPLGTPTALVATWPGANPVQLSWGTVTGANIHYEIWRRDHGGAFGFYATSNTPSFDDPTVSAGTTYVYEVRALDSNNESASSFSNRDLATTMTFTAFGDGRILRNHVTELLTALNSMQTAQGWTLSTWVSILQGNPPPPAPALNVIVYAEHILALRRNMDLVYAQLLGTTPPPYTDPTLTDPTLPGSPKVAIKWLHITELRSRVQ